MQPTLRQVPPSFPRISMTGDLEAQLTARMAQL
jgi:hypothetical protein